MRHHSLHALCFAWTAASGLLIASAGCSSSRSSSRSELGAARDQSALCYTLATIPRGPDEGHGATALDARGRVLVTVGGAFDESEVAPGAFLWDGARHDLRPPTSMPTARVTAAAMNDAGAIVGGTLALDGAARLPLRWVSATASAQILEVPGAVGSAVAINAGGDVLVEGEKDARPHGYLLRSDAWIDLGEGRALDLNNRGEVLLMAEERVPSFREFPVLWREGVRTELRSGDAWSVSGQDLNDRGEVVATASYLTGRSEALLFREGTRVVLPGLDASRPNAAAFALNNRGDVVGWSELAASPLWATLWRAGTPIDVAPKIGEVSSAYALNERGRVIGALTEGAFVWENGATASLPTLPGFGVVTSPRLINESNVVAGNISSEHGYDSEAAIWTPCGGPGPDAGPPDDGGVPEPEEPGEE